MTQKRRNLIMKGILMMKRLIPTHPQTKEELMEEMFYWYSEENMPSVDLDGWINSLREDLKKTPEQREAEAEAFAEELAESEAEWEYEHRNDYCPSCTAGDYGPGNPWDAPGMSIKDFI